MESQPLVSIILPTYNYASFICEAIDSVLNSDFNQNDVEIIVIDDGSRDDTLERLRAYKSKIKYIYQENSGKARATQVGIECARGKYLFNLDSDDLFLPNKIKEVVSIFEKDREIVHVAHPTIYWDVINNTKDVEPIPKLLMERKINGKDLLSYFYKRNMLFGGGSTFAAHTEILKNLTIPKEAKLFVDEYLLLFTLNSGYSFFIEQPLSMYRIHGKNDSNRKYSSDIDKTNRDLKCLEAILSAILQNDFQADIKKLYLLKTKVADISLKEQLKQKSFHEVLDIWLYVMSNIKIFKQDIFRIIKAYTILNRSIPTSVLKLLKQAKTALYQ